MPPWRRARRPSNGGQESTERLSTQSRPAPKRGYHSLPLLQEGQVWSMQHEVLADGKHSPSAAPHGILTTRNTGPGQYRPAHRRFFSASAAAHPLSGPSANAPGGLPQPSQSLDDRHGSAIPPSQDEEFATRKLQRRSLPQIRRREHDEPASESQTVGHRSPSEPGTTALRAPGVHTGAVNEARPTIFVDNDSAERRSTTISDFRLSAPSRGRTASYDRGPSSSGQGHGPGLHRRSASWTTAHESRIPNPLSSHPWVPRHRTPVRRQWKVNELFSTIPAEVLGLILSELKRSHLSPESGSCATCWMRDACSLALASKKWSGFARVALYEDISLSGPDSVLLQKRCKVKGGARLILLRKSLRANVQLASLVHSLKVPERPPNLSVEDYEDLLASVIMVCPNFERLVGYYPSYSHRHSRLFHALSTRQRLKSMNWILEQPGCEIRPRTEACEADRRVPFLRTDLYGHESAAFRNWHANWEDLAALTLHCKPGALLSPPRLLSDSISLLPSLQALNLSHLPATAFNDVTLASLPPLKHLSISHCPGVSSAGLTAFASCQPNAALTSLTLIHVNLDSLSVVARLLANLPNLATFSIVQAAPPGMPQGEPILLFPYLASASLVNLHWDIPCYTVRASTADVILARSIAAKGFPALRRLRAPHDPEGIFQAVCRPRERCDLPSDREGSHGEGPVSGHLRHAVSGEPLTTSNQRGGSPTTKARFLDELPPSAPVPRRIPSFSALPTDGYHHDTVASAPATLSSETRAGTPPAHLRPHNSNLRLARLAAQARLEAARRSAPRFFITVSDADRPAANGEHVEYRGVGSFIGSVRSRVCYWLLPDADGGTDESGGLVGVDEMLGDCGESLVVVTRAAAAGTADDDEDEGMRRRGRADSASDEGGVKSEREKAMPRKAVKLVKARRDTKDKEGLMQDLRGDSGMTTTRREGCTGEWRWRDWDGGFDRKQKEKHQHTERGRWRDVVLS